VNNVSLSYRYNTAEINPKSISSPQVKKNKKLLVNGANILCQKSKYKPGLQNMELNPSSSLMAYLLHTLFNHCSMLVNQHVIIWLVLQSYTNMCYAWPIYLYKSYGYIYTCKIVHLLYMVLILLLFVVT